MNRRASDTRNIDWRNAAQRAADLGDFAAAKSALLQALQRDRKNASLFYNLAIVEEHLRDTSAAAVSYSTALRFAPQDRKAAAALVRLLAVASPDAAMLDPAGVKAALALDIGGTQALAAAGLHHRFAHTPALTTQIPSSLVVTHTHAALQDDLLLASLRAGSVCDRTQERVFTALRRAILLETAAERFVDRGLTVITLALIQQVWNNDFAWAQTREEADALDRIALDTAALASGSLDATRDLLRLALYRPLDQLAPVVADAAGIKPKAARDLFSHRLRVMEEEARIADALPRLREAQDPVSQRVARQYAGNPFPRWRGLHTSSPGVLRTALLRFFPDDRLRFMDGPFHVLIAGTGTGQHALQAALDYGPNAQVLAVDISAPSLAYAERQRRELAIANASFMVADILDLRDLGRTFNVIECVGTLHHMADPWAGLRVLTDCLAPQGLIYLGLYSRSARQHIADIAHDPAFPGRGCSDSAARAFRADLLSRPDATPGARMVRSPSFWNLNEFRDLVLHEQEHRLSLPEIARALNDAQLTFRGFTLDKATGTRFAGMFPEAEQPGSLSQWDAFEQTYPGTFAAMYCFWCEPAAGAGRSRPQ